MGFLKRTGIIFLFMVVLAGVALRGMAQEPDAQADIAAIAKLIEAADSAKNYPLVLAYVRQLQQKRVLLPNTGAARSAYYRALHTALTRLESFETSKSVANILAQRDAQRILLEEFTYANEMSLNDRVALTLLVIVPSKQEEAAGVAQRRELRRTKVAIYLATWREVQKQIDPHFNSNDAPVLDNASLAFSDPQKQAEYEAHRQVAQKAMKEKSERFNAQVELRSQSRELETRMKTLVVAAYTQAPYDTDELRHLLADYKAATLDVGKQFLVDVESKTRRQGTPR